MMGEDCWAPEPAVEQMRRPSPFAKASSALRTRVLGATGLAKDRLARRHDSGLHSLACLHDAHMHYGEPVEGFGYRVWQTRNYFHGFFHP